MFSLELDTTQTPHRVRLSGEARINHASEMAEAFKGIDQTESLCVDCSQLSDADVILIQMLKALQKECTEMTVYLKDGSPVDHLFERMNLKRHFKLTT